MQYGIHFYRPKAIARFGGIHLRFVLETFKRNIPKQFFSTLTHDSLRKLFKDICPNLYSILWVVCTTPTPCLVRILVNFRVK